MSKSTTTKTTNKNESRNRLYAKYTDDLVPLLRKELTLSNPLEVPRISKISINAGIGPFRDNKEAVAAFSEELAQLTGQRPMPTLARLSEAGFKIRKGDVVGLTVTLRRDKMWAFLDKLINIVFPRVRDFRGLNLNSFDKGGNYSVGILDHTVFPEIDPNKVKGTRHLQITIVTNSHDVEKSRTLLKYLGLPFKESN